MNISPESRIFFPWTILQNKKNGFHDKFPLDGRLAWERYMYDDMCVRNDTTAAMIVLQ